MFTGAVFARGEDGENTWSGRRAVPWGRWMCWEWGTAGAEGQPEVTLVKRNFSLRDFLSDDESEKRNVQSSDDSFEPYPEKK